MPKTASLTLGNAYVTVALAFEVLHPAARGLPSMTTRTLFYLLFTAGLAFVAFAQAYLLCKIYRFLYTSGLYPRLRQILFGTLCALFALMYFPYPLRLIYKWPEHEVSIFVLYGLLYPFSLWGMASIATFLIVLLKDVGGILYRVCKPPSPAPLFADKHLGGSPLPTRREFLRWTFGAVAVSPLGVFAYSAAIGKERYEIVEHAITLPRLSPRLHGLRIVQLTDIHVGNFMKRDKLERYVHAVNDLQPDIVALTGDFIGSSSHFIPACAAALEKIEAREGVFACLGNHDYWVGAQNVAEALESAGVQVMRNEAKTLILKGAALNIAGVDDPWRGKTDFDRPLSMIDSDAPTVMLCHQPDLFPAIARRAVDLTLSGHYHGGQVKLQFLGMTVSPAHLISEFVEGHYRRGPSQLYVSRGIGITGPPVRLNAPPEITLLHLA
jgi:predicted MPP superfamily phosphohydrolase